MSDTEYMTPETQKVQNIKRRYDIMKREKSPWISVYNILARYILGRKNFMTSQNIQPDDLFDPLIFDDTASNANHLLASSNVGALWPNGAKSIKLLPPSDMKGEFRDTDEIKEYFEYVTKTITDTMDNPKCGFLTTLEEYLIEQGALGTSAIFVEESDDVGLPVLYRPISARDIFIDTSPNGNVDTIYISKMMTFLDIYKEYGPEALTPVELKNLYTSEPSNRQEVLIAIEPRLDYMPGSLAAKDFPYASCHINVTKDTLLKESGFKELPVFVGRFWHALGEKYGRSPGMNALPSIREANELRYDLILAYAKMLSPAMSMVEGSVLGDEVDTSPKALVILSMSGKLPANFTGKPLEKIIDVEDPSGAATRLAELVEIINNHFFKDRIIDLNNESRMTLGEANIRNQLRGQTLNTVYSRQDKEILEPCVERTFNILLEKGLLGVVRGTKQEAMLLQAGQEPIYVPDVIAQRMVEGKEIYRIQFISPAARIRQSEESSGIQQTLERAVELAQIDPAVMDSIDLDWTIKRSGELDGAPSQMFRSAEAVANLRKSRQQQQQAAEQQQQQMAGSEALKNVASAQANLQQK